MHNKETFFISFLFRTAPPYRPTIWPTVRPTVRPHRTFSWFSIFSKHFCKPHRTAQQFSFHDTAPHFNSNVLFHDLIFFSKHFCEPDRKKANREKVRWSWTVRQYRGMKIVRPYGGARNFFETLWKSWKRTVGVQMWGGIVEYKSWGRTVGREQVQNMSWRHSDGTTTAFWRHSYGILTAYWRHSDGILTAFWRHTDGILTAFWRHSDDILTAFWRHS